MSDIAKNIKKLRQKKNLTQEELAEKLFVTRQAVSNWETGKNQPDIAILKNLAEVMEVDIKEILYGPETDEGYHRRVLVAVVLCVLTAVAWATYFPLVNLAQIIQRNRYDMSLGLICILGLKPLAFMFSGAALPAVFTLWSHSPLIKWKSRQRMLLLGLAALLCLFWVWMSLGTCQILPLPTGCSRLFSFSLSHNQWLFLFVGILFFCGWPRKAG